MGNIAPQDISNQIPAFSILTSAYLFRDADHLKTFFASDAGAEMKKMAEDQLGIKILGPTYFGTRQVGLRIDKHINTPADMAGVKLRMPGGDAWQFLGQALGANPTPMAYAEVYTGLQTGAIDGQDNPLPNVENMKFYEVDEADRADLASGRLRPAGGLEEGLGRDGRRPAGGVPEGRRRRHRLVDRAAPRAREPTWSRRSRRRGWRSTRPTSTRSASYAQKKYLESDLSKDWPAGMLDKINAL